MEPKALLIQILKDFEREYNKLNKADILLTSANNASWDTCGFFSNMDVERLRARKAVIDNIHKELWDEIATYSQGSIVSHSVHISNKQFETKLDALKRNTPITEERARTLLDSLCNKCLDIMRKEPIQKRGPTTKTYYADMDNDEKRMALKEHSFSDKWLFNFLAKIVARIRNGLHLKTTSEKLLESTIEKTKPPQP